jgi:radical SAM protein with 4Fe4S-binding SPASM domain
VASALRKLKDVVKTLPGVGPWLKDWHDLRKFQRRQARDRRNLEILRSGEETPGGWKIGHEPTIRCNLTCFFCYQGESRSRRRKDLGADDVIRIYEGIEDIRKTKLVGGEIFVYKGIEEVLDYLDERGVKMTLQTNGTLINESNIGELARRTHIKAMIFSLDGPEEVHNQVRGHPKAFAQCMEAIRLVQEHMPWAEIGIFAVLLPENQEHFERLFAELSQRGIHSIQVLLEQYYSSREISAAEKMLEKRHGFEPGSYWINTNRREEAPFELEELRAAVEDLRRLGRKHRVFVSFTPEDFVRRLDVYHGGPGGKGTQVVCSKVLNNEVRIDPKGNVLLCDVVEASFGNLTDQSLEDITSSERFQRVKRDLVEHPLPVCYRCCKAVYL